MQRPLGLCSRFDYDGVRWRCHGWAGAEGCQLDVHRGLCLQQVVAVIELVGGISRSASENTGPATSSNSLCNVSGLAGFWSSLGRSGFVVDRVSREEPGGWGI